MDDGWISRRGLRQRQLEQPGHVPREGGVGTRAVLAGDHLQLPPTVTSDEAARAGLGTTLFQRAHAKWNDHGVAKMLTTQYRMHEDIMRWASDEMYEGKLEAADFVAKRALPRDPENASGNPKNVDAYPALMLVDTAGCDGMEERCEEEGESKDAGTKSESGDT